MKALVKLVVAGLCVMVSASVVSANCGACAAKPTSADEATAVKAQTTCPVMGGKINKDVYVDQDGKRIYVCCQGCIAAVKKDFATYAAKLEKEGVTLASVPVVAKPQTTCPVMGGKINKDLYVDQDGKRIYVCCQGCVAAVKKDFATYAAKLEKGGVTLGSVPAKPMEGDGPHSHGEGHRH